jgi:hypothetical protein
VYFGRNGDIFSVTDIKVAVFQKTTGDDYPVCYCFGWTNKRIQDELKTSNVSLHA